MGAVWLTAGGAFLGAFLGALVNLVVGEGKRRRDEDTALLSWVTQLYGWVIDGRLSPDQASGMLDARRVTRRWWKFNQSHADRIDQILDQLDAAFVPDPPENVLPDDEEFELATLEERDDDEE